MTLLVLDASVAAKWFLPHAGETLVEEAFDLLRRRTRQEVEFIVPDLFWSEFGNVLWKTVRLRRLSEESAMAALRQMSASRLHTVPANELLEDALPLAIATGRSLYDSLYVALAVRSNAVMVTADERLANALAARWPVKWLGVL